jgi:exodeoxyribonuclease VII large subunit
MIGSPPVLSVSEFVAVLNQSLEMIYPQVAITGELSNFRVSKGRWVYFDLKDEYSSVKFFGSVHSLPGPLEDGITCEVIGRPRLHNLYGFSVNFESVRAVGEGSIRKAQDLLLRKLEAEGLFAPERKRTLPYPPGRIGLVTSAESAAIADFRKIIAARWPSLEIELIDTLVQGASAPAAIVQAIQAFNLQSNPPEMLVLIRGGGSADDLAAFSEESVVRAVAACRLPTMVAIGHEKDVSLAELVADKRASTPSNAAELLVPDIKHERQLATAAKKGLDELMRQHIKQGLEDAAEGQHNLKRLLEGIFLHHRHELSGAQTLLAALDPLMPLKQGYALVRSSSGQHIKKAAQLSREDVFSLEFTDGKKHARLAADEQ